MLTVHEQRRRADGTEVGGHASRGVREERADRVVIRPRGVRTFGAVCAEFDQALAEPGVDPLRVREHHPQARVDDAGGAEPPHAQADEARPRDRHRRRGEPGEAREPVDRVDHPGRAQRAREGRVDEHERTDEVGMARREPDGKGTAHRIAHDDRRPDARHERREQARVRAERRAAGSERRAAEAGEIEGDDARLEARGQRFAHEQPVHRAPTEPVHEDDGGMRAASRIRAAAVPLDTVYQVIVGRDPDLVHDDGSRSRPSASRRSSCHCIQTVWYESSRGDVNQSCSPSSTRVRAVRRHDR